MAQPSLFPRALLFDLDGTLLAPGSRVTERTMNALRRARDRGTVLALATGGFSYRAQRLARQIDGGAGRTWAMTHNGAAIWDPAGHLAHYQTMPEGAMRAVLETAGPEVWCVYEALAGGQRTEVYYSGRRRQDLNHFVWGPEAASSAPDAQMTARRTTRRRPAGQSHLDSVLGCWCLGTPRALAALDSQVEHGALRGARYLAWSQRLAQILARPRLQIAGRDVGPLLVNKGAAAQWLCDRLGIAPAETAAFGDATNDVELLRFAGRAVAMGNATPDALAESDEVAPRNTEDGVAQVLERWLDLGHL